MVPQYLSYVMSGWLRNKSNGTSKEWSNLTRSDNSWICNTPHLLVAKNLLDVTDEEKWGLNLDNLEIEVIVDVLSSAFFVIS
jgi:hypothetical protein